MTKIKIPNSEIHELIKGETIVFPKYTTQLMNLANQNAQGTRPKVVGQMSELINEFNGSTIKEWKQWYLKKHPESIDTATDRIYTMIESLKEAIIKIDKEMVSKWVEELVITKTFTGLKFQDAILIKVAQLENKSVALATPADERKGIDGYIGEQPVSIKPITYKYKSNLNETIEEPLIYYEKKKDGINIEFEKL